MEVNCYDIKFLLFPSGGVSRDLLTPELRQELDGKAAAAHTHSNYLPLTGGTLTGDLRIKGSGNYGTKINLGDGDYVHISEPTDDNLEIKAKNINFVVTGDVTKNGAALGGYVTAGQRSGTTLGDRATAEGESTTASGENSHAEGFNTTASGTASHAEGFGAQVVGHETEASGTASHVEGYGNKATATAAHCEGFYGIASGESSHAEGDSCEAIGKGSHAEGSGTSAKGYASHSGGRGTIAGAGGQTAIGKHNKESTSESDRFIIGKGSAYNARANCLRVTDTGVYASGNYNASGADYAEMFEWLDGNPENQDRAGLFVTLDGEKIRLAMPGDDFILGVVSGNPSVVGDVYDDQWRGMFETDIFGRSLWETVDVPAETMDITHEDGTIETVEIRSACIETHQKLNPNYNNDEEYLPRSDRPEWDAVGMMGKLVAVDDGTCEVNGWCTVGMGGIAVKSDARTRYRVMARLDDTHIRILIL